MSRLARQILTTSFARSACGNSAVITVACTAVATFEDAPSVFRVESMSKDASRSDGSVAGPSTYAREPCP